MGAVVQVEPLGVPALRVVVPLGATGLSPAVDLQGYELIGIFMPTLPTVALATSASAGQLLIAGMTLQVLDFAAIHAAQSTVTVTINGVPQILKEGTNFNAVTSNNQTATNLAAAIDALIGVSATATTDTVTVVASPWQTAAISFQASATGVAGAFADVYDEAGTELSIASTSAVTGRAVLFGSAFKEKIRNLRYLKLRSGLTGAVVNQIEDKTLTLLRRQGA